MRNEEEKRLSTRRWTTTITARTMAAGLLWLGLQALPLPSHADTGLPEVSPALKKMLGGLPLADYKDDVQGLVGTLKKSTCGGGLTGCYATKSGPLQLYFFTSKGTQQTFLLVIDKKVSMPTLLKNNVQKVFGNTALASPIISISTTDYVLDINKMPPDLQDVVRKSYFNVPSLEFASGVQLAARADLGGALRVAMASTGVLADGVMLRAAVVMPIPTDLVGGAGTGAGLGNAMAHGDSFKKAGSDAMTPEAFVEISFAPNAKLFMTAPPMELTDATFFINNELVFGYKGYAGFPGVKSTKTLLQFQTPLTPEGAMDFADFSFRMSSPASQSLEDVINMMADMAVSDKRLAKYGGGFIRNIASLKQPLLAAAKPLSVFKTGNPNPAPPYKFGDSSKPFPTDLKYFNVALAGPLANGGPLMKYSAGTSFMGVNMGSMDVWADANGLRGKAVNNVGLKLGPLGKVTIEKMVAEANVSLNTQLIRLKGNYGGQVVEVTLDANTLTLNVPANCVNPFEIKARLAFDANTDITKVFDAQGGANVDPASITGCVGQDLEKALNKIAGEYKNLSGYSATQANQALKKIHDDAARAYQAAKDAARDAANKATNVANNAFRDAGNAFKHIGKKKKHSKGPDPKFAASVFDWDYYYDNAPDVVAARVDLATHWRDSGFNEGRQGSPEFSAVYYWKRYLDVQAQCPGRDLQCALQHWLDTGLAEGRQGSSGFSIYSYLNRYPDLIGAFGVHNYIDAMDHWQNNGEDEGRDGSPTATANGPLAGFRQIGGGGGGEWSDEDGGQCKDQYVTGFRVRSGGRVDGIQFKYSGRGWSNNQGYNKGGYTADVSLPDGEYIVRVDYRSGSMVDNIAFITNRGRAFGPYGGGGGTWGSYSVTPGEKLGCIAGRAGSSIDHLTFSSTGPR
jgi:hypothetical protein